MKVLVGLRRPEVPGFCPSMGEVVTEVTFRAPNPSKGVRGGGRERGFMHVQSKASYHWNTNTQ